MTRPVLDILHQTHGVLQRIADQVGYRHPQAGGPALELIFQRLRYPGVYYLVFFQTLIKRNPQRSCLDFDDVYNVIQR